MKNFTRITSFHKTILSAIIILFLTSNNIIAQDGYDDGTTWHYGFMVEVYLTGTYYKHQLLTIDGDTTINGDTYQRMFKSNLSFDFQSPYNVEYIRKVESKVFWYNQYNNEVSILYDFGAQAGESWNISIADCYLTIIVDSVNYSDYNGIIKKNLYITDYISNEFGFVGEFFAGKVIEGIGHTDTYFPHGGFFEMCNGVQLGKWYTGLRCYEDNDLHYNFNTFPCDSLWLIPWFGVDEYDKNNSKVYPNPVSNILTIETQNNTDIIITDIVGRIIEKRSNCNSICHFNTSKWRNGIYFVNICSKGQKITTERVIKSEL